jgi:hypothetical protein
MVDPRSVLRRIATELSAQDREWALLRLWLLEKAERERAADVKRADVTPEPRGSAERERGPD